MVLVIAALNCPILLLGRCGGRARGAALRKGPASRRNCGTCWVLSVGPLASQQCTSSLRRTGWYEQHQRYAGLAPLPFQVRILGSFLTGISCRWHALLGFRCNTAFRAFLACGLVSRLLCSGVVVVSSQQTAEMHRSLSHRQVYTATSEPRRADLSIASTGVTVSCWKHYTYSS